MPRSSTQFTTTTSNLLSAPHTTTFRTFTFPSPPGYLHPTPTFTTPYPPTTPNNPTTPTHHRPTPPPTTKQIQPPFPSNNQPENKPLPIEKKKSKKKPRKNKNNVPPNPLPRPPLPAPLGLCRPPLLPGHGLRQLPSVCRRAGAAAACAAHCAGRGLSAVVCPLSSSSSHFCGLFLLFGLFFVWVVCIWLVCFY